MSSKFCTHSGEFDIVFSVTRVMGSVTEFEKDHMTLQVALKCKLCGMPFEFVGLPKVGVPNPEMAAVNPTGLIVQLPIRPGFTKFMPGVGIGLPPVKVDSM